MTGIGSRIAPARFVLFLGLLAAGVAVAVGSMGWRRGFLIGFDVAAVGFLLSLVPLFRDRGADAMRARSRANDANRVLLLAITGAVMVAIMTAIAAELSSKGGPSPAVAGLIVATLLIAWVFSNAVYALHYAHVFYLQQEGEDKGGLDFPDCDEPDYWDFAYFAFTLGMTFQTSDVSIRSRALRTTALFHSLAAFIFNIGVLAFSINVLGG
ncbi:DUF1345 domain-containing protein [Sphingomonas quercus]|uniref:DUF1345 domain-containing protein n=1 Tax=Sphingomonas quercus TaxID=2842451 RepID=A0ABS6BHY4_9SPHN|nr:DUF1345 domain-containing protein [Sphingomonas quercus]MBU3076854.1 DUF1345 domain-containing protein [Sphingomonas quercus]